MAAASVRLRPWARHGVHAATAAERGCTRPGVRFAASGPLGRPGCALRAPAQRSSRRTHCARRAAVTRRLGEPSPVRIGDPGGSAVGSWTGRLEPVRSGTTRARTLGVAVGIWNPAVACSRCQPDANGRRRGVVFCNDLLRCGVLDHPDGWLDRRCDCGRGCSIARVKANPRRRFGRPAASAALAAAGTGVCCGGNERSAGSERIRSTLGTPWRWVAEPPRVGRHLGLRRDSNEPFGGPWIRHDGADRCCHLCWWPRRCTSPRSYHGASPGCDRRLRCAARRGVIIAGRRGGRALGGQGDPWGRSASR